MLRIELRMDRWIEDLSFCFGEPWRLFAGGWSERVSSRGSLRKWGGGEERDGSYSFLNMVKTGVGGRPFLL